MINFGLGVFEDIEKVSNLYELAKQEKYCVWDDEYPTYQNALFDFEHDCLYVLKENDLVIGAISINYENELPNNDSIWWYTKNPIEIARVVIHPSFKNKGYGELMVKKLCKILSLKGIYCIHLLVEVNNLPALKLYKKCGFHECCEGFMYGHNYYYYEKRISTKI